MTPGKLAAQAGHAFLGAQLAATNHPDHSVHAKAYALETPGTKVVLSAPLWRIRDLKRTCEGEGIPHFLVIDEGHVHPPDFTGDPIETAIGIGPIPRSISNRLMRKLAPC